MTIPEWIAQSRARCEAATPLKWRADSRGWTMAWGNDGLVRYFRLCPDMAFDSHARTDLPRALKALELALGAIRVLRLDAVEAEIRRILNGEAS
jgi:hypothetical protein